MKEIEDLFEGLETERLVLRKIVDSDADMLYKNIFNNFDYYKFYYQLPFNSFDEYYETSKFYAQLFSDFGYKKEGNIIKLNLEGEINKDLNIVDLIINMGVASSKREAREFITSNAISINGDKVNDLEYVISDKDFLDDTYIVIKRGKKNYYIGINK